VKISQSGQEPTHIAQRHRPSVRPSSPAIRHAIVDIIPRSANSSILQHRDRGMSWRPGLQPSYSSPSTAIRLINGNKNRRMLRRSSGLHFLSLAGIRNPTQKRATRTLGPHDRNCSAAAGVPQIAADFAAQPDFGSPGRLGCGNTKARSATRTKF
jgi:hypothetical protein